MAEPFTWFQMTTLARLGYNNDFRISASRSISDGTVIGPGDI